MPAKSFAESKSSVPYMKYELFASYKAVGGEFEVVDQLKKKEVSAEVGGDKAKLSARKAEWCKSSKSLRMVVAAVRQSFVAEDGSFELTSQDVDSTADDLIALRVDYTSQPTEIGKFATLFGRYDKAAHKFVGGKYPKFKSSIVFVGLVDGRPAKLELSGNTARTWREESKEKSLSNCYAVEFKSKDETVTVGSGKTSKVIHPITVDASPETAPERTAADEMLEKCKAERAAYQAQLSGNAATASAPATSAGTGTAGKDDSFGDSDAVPF